MQGIENSSQSTSCSVVWEIFPFEMTHRCCGVPSGNVGWVPPPKEVMLLRMLRACLAHSNRSSIEVPFLHPIRSNFNGGTMPPSRSTPTFRRSSRLHYNYCAVLSRIVAFARRLVDATVPFIRISSRCLVYNSTYFRKKPNHLLPFSGGLRSRETWRRAVVVPNRK
jgi:hypothetical protein